MQPITSISATQSSNSFCVNALISSIASSSKSSSCSAFAYAAFRRFTLEFNIAMICVKNVPKSLTWMPINGGLNPVLLVALSPPLSYAI